MNEKELKQLIAEQFAQMISEQVLYLFLYPWILFIATIPGAVLTFVFAGFAGQLLNYLPEKK